MDRTVEQPKAPSCAGGSSWRPDQTL